MRSNRRYAIRVAFGLIIGAFVAANMVALANMRASQNDTRRLAATSLTAVELVSRMAQDIEPLWLLIDAHIFEKNPNNMKALETRLTAADDDFAAAARAYEPLATTPYERVMWERLKHEIVAIREPVQDTLAHSRRNEDVYARSIMSAIQSRFDVLGHVANALIEIKHGDAARAVARIDAQQRWARYLLLGLTGLCSALALILAGWVIRLLARQDRRVRDAFSLLEQRNRDLDAFAGRVAHDLRGPLTTISLSASRLSEQLPRETGTLAVLERGVGRMERVIEDLLTLSRVGGQAPGTTSNPTAVGAAVEQDLAQAVANVDGVLRVDVEPAEVTCSAGLLRQVLWNLGENAIKYRRPESPLEIQIEGRVAQRTYTLRVTDNGTGMTPSEVSEAFQPFFRSERVRSTPGTGLGLSITKRIIEASGGTLSIDSHVGQGTSFVITLPLVTKPSSSDELFPVLHDV